MKFATILGAFLVLFNSTAAFAGLKWKDYLNFSMFGRIRTEGYSNLGFAPGGEDPRFTASKFRMTMETGPGVSTKWKFVF
ncbi:MAG: hypothetical protein DRQ88_03460, partial [Epsilonproteobacteria bacterium]